MAEGQAEAITVRSVNDGFQGITGFRRVQAVSEFGSEYGIETVRAEVRDLSKFEAIQARIHSNLDRKADTIYDQGELCDLVADELTDPTQADIAGEVGKSRSWVGKALSALDHPSEVKEAVEDGDISQNTASAVAQEPDPDVREKAIETAKADESPEEAQKEALEEARLEAGYAKEASGELSRYAEYQDRFETGLETLEEKAEVESQIEDLEQEEADIWDTANMQAQDRYNAYKKAQNRLETVESAIELVESESDRLAQEAADIEPSEEATSRLETWENQADNIMAQIGDPTVTVTDKNNGDISVQINITFDPNDPPELVGEFMEQYRELTDLMGDIEELEGEISEYERLNRKATEVKSNVGVVLQEYPDVSEIDPDVREVLEDYAETPLGGLTSESEELAETVEEANESQLEEALESLEDDRERAEEIQEEVSELEEQLPPQGEEGRVNGYRTKACEALETARDHFEELDEEAQAAKVEAWVDSYSQEALEFLQGEGSMPDILVDESEEVSVEQNGSWFTVSGPNGESIKVQGSETRDQVVDTWESDGFEAVEEVAN